MKVCLPQLVRTIGSCKIIASASFDKNEDYTITSDVKFKISFPGQKFLHHNTAMEVSSL